MKCSLAEKGKTMENKKLIYADDARRAILEAEPKLAYIVDRIKGVDAVEVVRCKDCGHSYLDGEAGALDCCLHGMYVEPADYCSYGERGGENGSKQQG